MPADRWDEEESSSGDETSSSSPRAAPAAIALGRQRKFDDEEGEDSDVVDSWDADDSEEEKAKAKKEAEAKAKAAAASAAKKKPKAKLADKVAERARIQAEADAEAALLAGETEAERRERLRQSEKDADLQHAADLFGEAGLSAGTGTRKSAAVLKASAVVIDKSDPSKTVDISTLPLLNPTTKTEFEVLRAVLGPLIAANSKKPHYALFLQEFTKDLWKQMPSDAIKKANSALITVANEKLREEKASSKGGKKTKAAKTKTTLAISRPNTVDTGSYDDPGYGDDDFM